MKRSSGDALLSGYTMALVASVLACSLMKKNACSSGAQLPSLVPAPNLWAFAQFPLVLPPQFGFKLASNPRIPMEVSPPRADVGAPPHKFTIFRYLQRYCICSRAEFCWWQRAIG